MLAFNILFVRCRISIDRTSFIALLCRKYIERLEELLVCYDEIKPYISIQYTDEDNLNNNNTNKRKRRENNDKQPRTPKRVKKANV